MIVRTLRRASRAIGFSAGPYRIETCGRAFTFHLWFWGRIEWRMHKLGSHPYGEWPGGWKFQYGLATLPGCTEGLVLLGRRCIGWERIPRHARARMKAHYVAMQTEEN